MRNLVLMEFGSHVYGTNVATSDKDYKSVFVPSGKDILLQRAEKTLHEGTKKDPHAKNTAEDIDIEKFTVQKYIKLLLEGQTVSLDMIFVPEKHLIEVTDEWRFIVENKEKFMHSGVLAFVGYCRTQANKYGIKGSRMGTIKKALTLFDEHKDEDKRLGDVDFQSLIDIQHVEMVDCRGPNNVIEPHLEICNRKFGMRTRMRYVVEALQKIYDGYGHRARQAEKNEGIDWKALMHAVRIKNQALEVLKTRNITFPRPEKDHLLKIRNGELDYKIVAKEIEQGLEDIENFESDLPANPDFSFAEKLILDIHMAEVITLSSNLSSEVSK